MTAATERVAIVGVGVRLPGAGDDLAAFWNDVAAARDLSRDVPAGRWFLPPDKCLDPRVPHPDAAPHSRGYYLDRFTPDLTGLGVEPAFVAKLDTLFHTVLDAGNRAWRSAKTAAVDRTRVGVVLGNICLPTDKANALCREFLGGDERRTHPLNRYVAGLPAGGATVVLRRVRAERKFESPEALRAQILRDVGRANAFWRRLKRWVRKVY